MDPIFAQHENDIVTLPNEAAVLVIGSYTGNSDLDSDLSNLQTELAKLFPGRFKETATPVVSSNTATLTGGAFDARLQPLVYVNDVLLDEDAYDFVAATGVFSNFSPALQGGDTVTVTLVKYVPGVQSVDPTADFPVKITDVKAMGSINYVYRTTSYDDAKYNINVKGAFDVRLKRRQYGPNDLAKSIFGSQYSSTSAAVNMIERNSSPFFVAIIWWAPDADTGEMKIYKYVFGGLTLNKGFAPKYEGTDKEASFEIDATSLYAYTQVTLGS